MVAQFKNTAGPPAPLLYVSSIFDCWDSQNNHIVTAAPITIVTNAGGWVTCRYKLLTGPNQVITSPGTYRYIITVTLSDGTVQAFEQVALIVPNP